MLGKLLNILAKFLIVIFLLLLAYVFFVVLINLRDKPPSAAAVEFEQAWNNRPPVDDENNGYLFLLGFDVAENQDPKAIGVERVEWTQTTILSSTEEFMSFPQLYHDFQKTMPKEIIKLLDLCGEVTIDCINNIDAQREFINQWSKSDAWIINRYMQLIKHKDWLELAKVDIRLPFPNYGDVMRVQRLIFIHALATLPTNDSGNITKLLDEDLRFWRSMLKNTDMLIGKMIAVAAIKKNFLWTNQIFLKLKSNNQTGVVLFELNKPFTDVELSVRRCLVGEWIFARSIVNPLDGSGIDNNIGKFLLKIAYQKQDTLNNLAESLNSAVIELDVSLSSFEVAFSQFQQKRYSDIHLTYYLHHPYNIAGQFLAAAAPPSMYTDYIARTKDLEGFRRGLLLSIGKMEQSSEELASQISPYQTRPFILNEKQRSITVSGLGSDARSQQIYFY